jgi:putative sterol carrier protein
MERLNASPGFAAAAGSWAGRLVLIEDAGEAGMRRTWVEVGEGRCLGARVATPGDETAADFVLAASPAAWDDLVTARTTPAIAAMLGRLKLLKGDVFALIPHAKAAAELLAAGAEGGI